MAVSSCLLGERVRYDGKEKGIAWIVEHLASEVEVVSICPEVGAGMSVPRPPIQLVSRPGEELRVVVVNEGSDVTAALRNFSNQQLARIADMPIAGYVFKARSPSCGLRDTPHFASAAGGAKSLRIASGFWAGMLQSRWPDLPCVDESELRESAGQEQFLRRVRAYAGTQE